MNPLRAKLSKQEAIYGVLSPSTDPILAEMFGICGLDYLMIEGEHRDPDRIEDVCRAAELNSIVPLARVASNDPKLILQYLDAGVRGIMLPGIKEASEVLRFIKAIKYPPFGERGLGPSRANNYLIEEDPKSITTRANEDIISIVQIETKEAYQKLESILKIEGIDLIVIGTADLSLSLGIDFRGEAISQVTQEIISSCNAYKIPSGLVATSIEEVNSWREHGVCFFINTLGNIIKSGSAL